MPLSDEAKKLARIVAIKWNSDNPTDYYWRKHFSIPFGSKEHLEVDFIDQQIWSEEMIVMKEVEENPNIRYDLEGRVIIDNKGTTKMSDEEIDETFDDLDLDTLNEKYGGQRK